MTDFVQQQDPSRPKHELVLHVLDKEIDGILYSQKRQGWTTWAILGSIAATIWLLLDVLEKKYLSGGEIDIKAVFILFLVFSVTIHWLELFVYTISPPQINSKNMPHRFLITNISIGASRVQLLVMIANHIGLILIAIYFPISGWWPKIILLSYYGIFAFIMTLLFLMSFFKLPLLFPTSRPSGFAILPHIFLLSLLFWSAISYYLAIISSKSISMFEYRTSILLVVISYLVALLSHGIRKTPILDSLIDIRRDLAFNRIDIDTAIQQSDIAVSGMQVSDVLQEEVRDLLQLIDKINIELAESLKRSKSIESILLKDSNTELLEDQKTILKTMDLAELQHSENIKKLVAEFKLHIRRLKKRFKWILFISKKSVSVLNNIIGKIEAAVCNIENAHNELIIKWSGIRKHMPQ